MAKPNVAVIGHTGMVGSEVFKYFQRKIFKTLGFSIDKRKGYPNSSWDEINAKSQIIFICVPTPYKFDEQATDFSIVEGVLAQIGKGKIAVIKSTVWPGFSKKMQNKYKDIRVVFNPEFLSRKTAKEDFDKPDRQLVGFTDKSKKEAQIVKNLLPRGKYNRLMKSDEAELIKYAHNIFGAMAIVYANHLYEISEKMGLNYDTVREGFAASKYLGSGILRYMNIFHNDKRGYGGPCFPKDVNSFIKFCESIKAEAELPIAARAANVRILTEQGISEKESEKY